MPEFEHPAVAVELERMLEEVSLAQLALNPHENLQRVNDILRIAVTGNYTRVRHLAEEKLEAATRAGLHPERRFREEPAPPRKRDYLPLAMVLAVASVILLAIMAVAAIRGATP